MRAAPGRPSACATRPLHTAAGRGCSHCATSGDHPHPSITNLQRVFFVLSCYTLEKRKKNWQLSCKACCDFLLCTPFHAQPKQWSHASEKGLEKRNNFSHRGTSFHSLLVCLLVCFLAIT